MRLLNLENLPPMPTVAARILQTTQDPDASAEDLARIIELDPSLAAQVLRQARSALYNYKGKLETIRDAVLRVLGFERVSQIALSIAASRAFDVPHDGPLGLATFWRHTLHCSLLAQRLAFHVPNKAVPPGMAYMGGLLHNFGMLLYGHLYRQAFELLNELTHEDRYQELPVLEKQVSEQVAEVIPLHHNQLGAVLLEHWNLPVEIVAAAYGHTERNYEGASQELVWTIQLSNCLLKELDLGDDLFPDDPVYYAQQLGIQPELVFEVFDQVKSISSEISQLAADM